MKDRRMAPKSMPSITSTSSVLVTTHQSFASAANSFGFGRPGALAGRFLCKTRAGARLLGATALAAWVAALAPQPAAAASITWGPATTISGDSDVAASGTPLYAYAGGATTVNGVSFTQVTTGTTWGSVSLTSTLGNFSANTFIGAAAPYNTLPSEYQSVLASAAWGGAATATLTLNGLTTGHDYLVQVWVNDARSVAAGRNETVTSSGGNSVTLVYNSTSATGGVGQYTTGFFTADSTSQVFTLTSATSVQLNAINVLDIGTGGGGPARTWLGSSSPFWGISTNWNPADNVLPGDAIIFNNLSTANLATMLDTSYTISTLTVSNAPSPVSIGPDGYTLTISSGICKWTPSAFPAMRR
jgi:hypothetical protein